MTVCQLFPWFHDWHLFEVIADPDWQSRHDGRRINSKWFRYCDICDKVQLSILLPAGTRVWGPSTRAELEAAKG
jgi:hypothetical protein